MARLAVLVAIIIVMDMTQIGFIMVGPVSITLMMIPVAIAAITVGPTGGAIAGAVFGLTAFMRGFGISPLATTLMGINPFFTFILMVIPRVLAGLIPGLIYLAIEKRKGKTTGAVVASVAAPISNTVLWVSTLVLLFGNTEFIVNTFGAGALAVFGAIITTNAVIEAGVGFVVGATVSRTLVHFFPGQSVQNSDNKEEVKI